MRTFKFIREHDLSGVSGVGTVAEGVEFENGQIALYWVSKYDIVEVIANLHTLEAVHGHNGAAKVVWDEKGVKDV